MTLADFFASPLQNAYDWVVRTTSGTSEQGPIVSVMNLSSGSEERQGWYFDAERTIICMGAFNSRVLSALSLDKYGNPYTCAILAVDYRDLAPELTGIISDFAPERIIGFPSFLARLIPYISPEVGSGVQKLCLGGEMITPVLAKLFASSFPNASYCLLYAAGEIGSISETTCTYLPLNYYHPLRGVTIEILDPDETGAGDLLVSKVLHGGISIEKYRIGDMARIHKNSCPCGYNLAFESLGRKGHDYIKLVGALLLRAEFDRVAIGMKTLFEDYRVEASQVLDQRTVKGKIHIQVFRIGLPGTEAFTTEIADRFSRELFLTPSQTLSDLVAADVFLPLSVEFTNVPFEQKHKDVKLFLKIA
ncbi:hypothetical protein A3A39_02250 [Candidatus Kaiserbacteria bacterium RIFCSPLOWO2_01_FULL_54_13]|uniref:AMP-dependent synthetase/ligase domain-containing protein n=1 Tax=Candidatus Kaiserbacteria bacterium RIFCSPLOWO2_01_FULL_54_13 TaxID=1798512 RepID=A0A1F6F185_9BACT|nr:MAG: hypothetical protein A3A39_02250 [Candidatus Kaiserbacteria bacterium RIFCSPLOWO2_01_FULL_54_13]